MVALNVVAQLGMQRLIYSMGTMSGGSIMLQRSLLLLTMAIVGLAACSESFTPEQSGYWLQKLEDEKTRIEGLKNLGKFKEPAVVDAVINLLEQKGTGSRTPPTPSVSSAIHVLSRTSSQPSTTLEHLARAPVHGESIKPTSTLHALLRCSRPMPHLTQLSVLPTPAIKTRHKPLSSRLGTRKPWRSKATR